MNPPLGSTSTRISGVPIRFYAAIQGVTGSTAIFDPQERFTVLLWYSVNGRGPWKPALFREALTETEDVVKLVRDVVHKYTYFCPPWPGIRISWEIYKFILTRTSVQLV